jgi:hypothetical protein
MSKEKALNLSDREMWQRLPLPSIEHLEISLSPERTKSYFRNNKEASRAHFKALLVPLPYSLPNEFISVESGLRIEAYAAQSNLSLDAHQRTSRC